MRRLDGVAEPSHGPVAAQACHVAGEVTDESGAVGRVRDLRMELHAVEAALVIGDSCEGRAGTPPDLAEAWRQPGHAVAMAHPHQLASAGCPHAVEQTTVFGDLDVGGPELMVVGERDLAAELGNHGLLAVADAEHGLAGLKNAGRDAGCLVGGDARRTAREDVGTRAEVADARGIGVEGYDLAIDAALAHAPGDELGELAAEVEDQHAVM